MEALLTAYTFVVADEKGAKKIDPNFCRSQPGNRFDGILIHF